MPDMKVTLLRRRKVISYERHEAIVIVTEEKIAAWAERNGVDRDTVNDDELIEIACDLHPVPHGEWESFNDDITMLDTDATVEPHAMLDVFRCPSHPAHAYSWVGSAETIEGARDLLPPVISCEEDPQYPGHWDAFAQGGGLYVLIPRDSQWAPTNVIGRPSC